MEWFCNNCKERFPTEYMHEKHSCKPVEKRTPFWKDFFNMIRCEMCGNRMSFDIYKAHACKKKEEKTMTSPESRMQIGVFVSPRRIDTSSMRLVATEFKEANYIVRGIDAEEPFTKIAKEMKSSVTVAAAPKVSELDNSILRKSDICIMFPSKHTYEGKEILKFTVVLGEFKVPVIVYPER